MVAADANRLEVFGTHHRPQPAAAGVVVRFEHDIGVAHLVFSRRPDGGDGDASRDIRAQAVVGLAPVKPPQRSGIREGHTVVLDVQIDRRGGSAGDHQRIKAGPLDIRSEFAAPLGSENAGSLRRKGQHIDSCDPANPGPSQRSGSKNNRIGCCKGRRPLDAGNGFFEQFGRQKRSAQMGLVKSITSFKDLHRLQCKVDDEYPAHKTIHKISPTFM